MTYEQFSTAVKDYLGPDKNRQNIATFLTAQIKAGARDLVKFIPQLRPLVVDKYSLAGLSGFKPLTSEGNVSIGVTSTDSQFESAWIVKRAVGVAVSIDPGDGDLIRRPLVQYGWSNRMDLKAAQPYMHNSHGYIAIGQEGSFWVYPKLKENEFVEISHRPIALTWADANQVPFGDDEAEAVSYWVKAKLRREDEGDLRLHDSYMMDYARKRSELYVRYKDRGNVIFDTTNTPLLEPEDTDGEIEIL